MWRTRQKLNEAPFFLTKVEKHADHIEKLLLDRRTRDELCYFLSAFVSAARSVSWLMRSECCRLANWEAWWKAQEVNAPKELLRIFNDLRVRSEKADPLQLSYSIRLEGDEGPPTKPDQRLSKVRMTIAGVGEDGERSTWSRQVIALILTVDELEGDDLLEKCRTYLQELERLVAACEMRFGAADP